MKIIQKIIGVVMIFALILSTTACTENNKNNVQSNDDAGTGNYPLTIVDSFNREIIIEKEPNRVISIAPNLTETIFALGQGEKLVGRTDWCDYPKEVNNIESIGSLMDPNIEKIVELNPDLVLVSTHFDTEVLKKLEELDIQVVGLYGEENIEGVYDIIDELGSILDAKERAASIIDNMKERIGEVKEKVKELKRPEVYYVVDFGDSGDFTAGKGTFIDQMINLAGGNNIAGELEGWKYSLERLIEQDPDILICSQFYNTKERLKEANGYKELSAVKEDRIYEIDNNILDRHGPRVVDGVEELAKILHPEKFK